MCIEDCEFCVAFKHVTTWFTFIVIVIITSYASRRVRPSYCLPPQSHATALATVQLFHPTLPLPLSKVPPLVVFGLPVTLPPSGVHPNAMKQSFTPSLQSTCPNQFHFLLRTYQLISWISAISTTHLFVILCSHLILSICLKHCHWKLLSYLSSVFVIFHVSQP